MVSENFIRELESIVGASHVAISSTGIELYSYDASLIKSNPAVVVFPGDTQEVAQVVKAANREGVAYVARGFGTNLSGGTISVTEGLVICMSRFNKILGIYPEDRYAVVQPGKTNLEVQEAVGKHNCFYAPDPASQKVSTLGGNVGENSGGPLCLKYGVTSNHILGMEMVTSDGEVVRVGGPVLDSIPGYDLRGLMVGSEGGLGIITELTLRILPKTETVITMLAIYDDIPSAANSVSRIIAAGIVPNTLEMMDATVIEAVESNKPCGYPRDAAAVLIIEVEGMKTGLKEQADQIQEICMATGCREVRVAGSEAERASLWAGRKGAFGAMAQLAPNYLVNDACVPRTNLPEALEEVAAIADKYHFRCGNVFHAGDGNLHPLLLFDSRNEDDLKRVHKAGWDIMEACVRLGGTITGEHGVGREKQEGMHLVFSGDDLNTQTRLKSAFDPNNKLNPDKVIPLSEPKGQPLPPTPPRTLKRPGGASASGVAEAMAEIKAASASGGSVIPVGAELLETYGNICDASAKPVKSLAMTDVIDYDHENQVITVGSGMSIDDLQALVAEHNQWLPIRPPFFKDGSTMGALAATAVSGPERMYYGAPRDFLMGLQYIDSEGKVISTGGKVVKNVAGYDMTRLLCGSNGTLGMITEGTWRIATKPELCTMTSGTGDLASCSKAAVALMTANLFPVYIAAVPVEGDNWRLTTGFEGLTDVVRHQTDLTSALLAKNGLTDIADKDYDLLTGPFKEYFQGLDQKAYVIKAGAITTKIPELFNGLKMALNGSQPEWFLDFGCGRIYVAVDTLDQQTYDAVCKKIASVGGHIRVDKAPEAFKRSNDVYGTLPRPEWKLMHAIKKALDPKGVFAPGRMQGKI
ncbi:MAG: glycolate oxidase [Desulfovibrionales bacterium]|jgi:glycolate oxidase subunit GlcD|nr:glycolate oxidase [Desulfovibrionales bacterium]